MSKLAPLYLLLLLPSCAFFVPKEPRLALALAPIPAYQQPWQKVLKVTTHQRHYTFIAHMQAQEEVLALAMSSPLGNTVLQVTVEKGQVTGKNHFKPIRMEDFVTAMQLALWPSDKVKQAVIAQGFEFEELEKMRRVKGEYAVRYGEKVVIENIKEGFRLEL